MTPSLTSMWIHFKSQTKVHNDDVCLNWLWKSNSILKTDKNHLIFQVTTLDLKIQKNRHYQSVVFNSDQTMALRAPYSMYSLVQRFVYTFDALWSQIYFIPHHKCIQIAGPNCRFIIWPCYTTYFFTSDMSSSVSFAVARLNQPNFANWPWT